MGRFGAGGDVDKVAGAMLLWLLFLLFCGNGKMKKFRKFKISKKENNKKTIRNDSRMEGSKEAVGWRRKIPN